MTSANGSTGRQKRPSVLAFVKKAALPAKEALLKAKRIFKSRPNKAANHSPEDPAGENLSARSSASSPLDASPALSATAPSLPQTDPSNSPASSEDAVLEEDDQDGDSTFTFDDDQEMDQDAFVEIPDKKTLKKMSLEQKYAAASAYMKATKSKNMTKTSRAFGIPAAQYPTFRRRHQQLNKPARYSQGKRQTMSIEQEDILVEWTHYLAIIGIPLTRKTLLPRVKAILKLPPEAKGPGVSWFNRFLKRHPDIKRGRPSGLDPQRARCFNYPTVYKHFQEFKAEVIDKGTPWENVWNMDEKGVQLSGGRKTRQEKYLLPSGIRSTYTIRSDNLELVTIIECVNADGSFMKPAFVFSGKQHQSQCFDRWQEVGGFAYSENGWTTETICLEWFEKVFVPEAQARNVSGKPIYLVFDGHGSHVTLEMREMALKNGIHLYALPPHTTHKLQPLDVGIFGPLQRKWANRCDELAREAALRPSADDDTEMVMGAQGRGMTKEILVAEYLNVRQEAFKESTILKAWEKCGLRPFNPNIFTEDDFAPSTLTSSALLLPPSYPRISASVSLAPRAEEGESGAGDDSYSDVDNTSNSEDGDHEDVYGDEDIGVSDQEGLDGTEMDDASDIEVSRAEYPTRRDLGLASNTADVQGPTEAPIDPNEPANATPEIPQINHQSATPTSNSNLHSPIEPRVFYQQPLTSRANQTAFASSHTIAPIVHDQRWNSMIKRSKTHLVERVILLEDRSDALEARMERAEAHSSLMAIEMAQWKSAQAGKESAKKKGRAPQIDSGGRHVLTAAEAMEAKKKSEEKKREKADAMEHNRAKRKLAEESRETQRRANAPSQIYQGSLKSRNKPILFDILYSLSLSATPLDAVKLLDKSGTNSQLIERIETYLHDHPELAANSQFSGLYPGQRISKRRAPDQEAHAETTLEAAQRASSRRRLALGEMDVQSAPTPGTFPPWAVEQSAATFRGGSAFTLAVPYPPPTGPPGPSLPIQHHSASSATLLPPTILATGPDRQHPYYAGGRVSYADLDHGEPGMPHPSFIPNYPSTHYPIPSQAGPSSRPCFARWSQ